MKRMIFAPQIFKHMDHYVNYHVLINKKTREDFMALRVTFQYIYGEF
jgi:hypothetical protein